MYFGKIYNIETKLKQAAEVAVETVLAVKPGERAIIITNPGKEVHAVSLALYDAISKQGGEPVLICQPVKTQVNYADPSVYQALRTNPEIVISMTHEKMGKDKYGLENGYEADGIKWNNYFHYLLHGVKKVRAFWSPSVTQEIFINTVLVDYEKMKKEVALVGAVLDNAEKIHIISPLGTDLSLGVSGRKAFIDDGDFTKAGRGGNLPAGEAFVSPELDTANGVIVFDGSISLDSGDIAISEPICAEVENGFVTAIHGGEEAEKLRNSLLKGKEEAMKLEASGKFSPEEAQQYARNARNIGELGIGLNPNAKIQGNMLVDEKAYKTCHVAIGANYDKDAPALIHLDGLITEPTISAQLPEGMHTVILDKGDLILSD
ncbi:MAG: aminopeptidase [Spirochaetia bacterium]